MKTNRKLFFDSFKVSLVVGTLLCSINQWEYILSWKFEDEVILKIVLNYVVPFSVALYSKVQILRKLK